MLFLISILQQPIPTLMLQSSTSTDLWTGRLYHADNKDTLLRWRNEGEHQSDSEDEDGDQLVDANDLDQDEQLLERFALT